MDFFSSINSFIKSSEHKIVMGPWVIPSYENQNIVEENITIIDHPWKKLKTKENDFKIIKKIYDITLENLFKKLNQIHNLEFNKRSWEIIIGIWLRSIITIIYEKKLLVELAINKYGIEVLKVGKIYHNKFSFSTEDFILDAQDPIWNDTLIKDLNDCEIINVKLTHDISEGTTLKKKHKTLKKRLFNTYQKITSLMIQKNKMIVTGLGMNFKDEISFKLRSFLFPHFSFPEYESKINKINTPMREKIKFEFSNDDLLNKIANYIIPKYIPSLFIEEFKMASQFIRIFYPKSPKSVITSILYYKKDTFKIFVARQVNQGCKYKIIQHGGGFGISNINCEEDFILSVSDTFYSWGWGIDDKKNKINVREMPSIILSRLREKFHHNDSKYLLFPISEYSQYTFRLYNTAQGFGQFDEFNNLISFYNKLPKNLKSYFRVCLSKDTHSWDLEARLIKNNMRHCLPNVKQKFIKDLEKTRIAIINTNSTTILESLILDIPTVWILEPQIRPIKNDKKIIFDELLKNKILFFDYESATNHIISIYENPNKWWKNNNTQIAKNKFIENFGKVDANMNKNFKSFLKYE